jgi:hypothetical protein
VEGSILDLCVRLGELQPCCEIKLESVPVDLPGGWRTLRWRATAGCLLPEGVDREVVVESETAGAALLQALDDVERQGCPGLR